MRKAPRLRLAAPIVITIGAVGCGGSPPPISDNPPPPPEVTVHRNPPGDITPPAPSATPAPSGLPTAPIHVNPPPTQSHP